MAAGISAMEIDAPSRALGKQPLRMMVGVTSDQTCLVLQGRLGALQRAGFDVTLVASPGPLLELTATAEGVVAVPVRMSRGISLLVDFYSLIQLWLLLWRVRPAITDFSTPKAGLLGNLAAWALRVPCRVYTLRGLKLESSRGWKQWLLLYSERMAAWCADVVLCNSESVLNLALELRIAPKAKMKMLGDGSSNGVDTIRFSPGKTAVRQELGIAEKAMVVGFVGRLTTDKGVPELLEAFELILRKTPKCWLLLVGWFDESEDALDMRWRLRIAEHPRIRHTGYVADAAPYYRAMDVLVLPTHREGFPNVALEASASGVAVIATASTGAIDAVIPEVTGMQIPVCDPEAIADTTLTLLRDAEKRRRMGAAGRAWVLERFSRERVLGLAVEFYGELVEQKGIRDRG